MKAFQLVFVSKPTHLSLRGRSGFGGYGGDRFIGEGHFNSYGGGRFQAQSGYVRKSLMDGWLLYSDLFYYFFTKFSEFRASYSFS